MLGEPLDAFHEHHALVDALLGLASLGHLVELLATATPDVPPESAGPDDFIDLLLGVACLGRMVLGFAGSTVAGAPAPAPAPITTAPEAWLR